MQNNVHGFFINENGYLEVSGVDLVSIAKKYKTPLYVYDESKIRENCSRYIKSLKLNYPEFKVLYAGKAFLIKELCRLVQEEGLGIDAVSGGEIFTALSSGVLPSDIYLHGNVKTKDELTIAIKNKIGGIIIDSYEEIDDIAKISSNFSHRTPVLLRVIPGIKPSTHEYIITGNQDTKFGLDINNGSALKAIKKIINSKTLEFQGIHCHIGSQIFQIESFQETAKIMINFINYLKTKENIDVKTLNLGGGLGIRYTQNDTPPDIEIFIEKITNTVKSLINSYNLNLPILMFEPGRSIVGESGLTLYKVQTIKEIPGIRKYIIVDGGMTDNIRPALYNAKYEAVIANKANQKPQEIATIAGRCCESGDILIKDIKLPPTKKGDIIAIFSTGAYNYSMANNYNCLPRPGVLFIKNTKERMVVKPETYEDLLINQL